MAVEQRNSMGQQAPGLIGGEPSGATSDRELLDRFLSHRDESAFANLVHRHGRTVWGVCRRVLQQQDAEDAFQAVFLTLARKADSIRKAEAVGSWLYGVAYRIAMKAKQNTSRRHDHEKQAAEAKQGDPAWGEAALRELQGLLDQEVQHLAAKYRAPFVLCCLEGRTKAEAAQELGWKEGTVSGRLAEARKLLQHRLARRGVSLSAIFTAGALAQNSAAAAPVLIDATVKAVLAPLTGNVAATLSPSAVALAESFMKTMAMTKLKAMLSLLCTAALVATGVTLATYQAAPENPKADPPEELLVLREPEIFLPRFVPLVRPIDEQVLTLAISPDGKTLVTGGGRPPLSGQLTFWDLKTGNALGALKGIGGVRTAAFSPDGETLATGDMTGTITLRDPRTGEKRATVQGHPMGVNGLAFSPDGTLLASAGLGGQVKLWDRKSLQERKVFLGHTDMVFSVAFFRNGKAIVSCGKDKTARIWDVATGKEKFTLQGHREGIEGVAVSPDDKHVATASWDGTVRLWDADTGKELTVLEVKKEKSPAFSVAFSPNNKLLASAGGDGTVHLWDVKTKQAIGSLKKHKTVVWSLAFSPDGKTLASGSSDKNAELWDVETAKNRTTLKTGSPANSPVAALAYAPGGRVVGMATKDKTVQIRDADTGSVLRLLPGHTGLVTCLAFSADGQTVASGSADKTVKVWNWKTGKERFTLKGHTAGVNAVAFAPDGKTLASAGDDKAVRLWDSVSGKEVTTLTGHTNAVRALAFGPGGRSLASGSADRTIRVWDMARELEPITLRGHEGVVRALAYSADGALASASEDATVKLWEPAQGKERLTLRGHHREVWALAFSPGGGTLVSGGWDKTMIVWDPHTGQAQGSLQGHQEAITALAYHPHGGQALSGSLDTVVLRWRTTPFTSVPLTLPGNSGGVSFAQFSPDGNRLASGGEGGAVTLWTRSLTAAKEPFSDRRGIYSDVAFSPDGRTMALANHLQVQICDVASGDVLRSLPMQQDTKTVAFSPDGKYLAVGTGVWNNKEAPCEARLFDVVTGRERARLPGHKGYIFRVQFSPDGKTLASTCNDRIIRLWEVPSGRLVAGMKGHDMPARGLVFLPDGTLVTAGFDGTIRFWDVKACRETNKWKAGKSMQTVDVSPDGTLLAACEGPWIGKGPTLLRVWDVGTGKVRHTLQGHASRLVSVAFTRDGRGLVAVGAKPNEFSEVNHWDLSTGRLRGSHRSVRNMEWTVAVSPDSKRVISASPAGFFLWDLDFTHKERTWPAHAGDVTCGLFLDGGAKLATGGKDGTVKVWDVAREEPLATLEGHKGAVRGLAALGDGKTLFSGSDDATVKRWDLGTAKETATLGGHKGGVSSLAISPDGKTLAAGGGTAGKAVQGELILWDPQTNQQRKAFAGIEKAVWSVAYSPDGLLLAGGIASIGVRVWDVKTGQVRATLTTPFARTVTFSPDGRLLIAGTGEESNADPAGNNVYLWDTTTWEKRGILQKHKNVIHNVAFSPGGGTLASASQDGTINLWSIPRARKNTTVAAAPERKISIAARTVKEEPVVATPGGPSALAEEPEADAPPAPKKGRWTIWLVAGVVCTLGLGVWLAVRQSRRAAKAPKSAPVPHEGPKPTPPVRSGSFPCSACGKPLKARGEMAGKKVKCPQCGEGIVVPRGKKV